MRKSILLIAFAILVLTAWFTLQTRQPRAAEPIKPAAQKWEYFVNSVSGLGDNDSIRATINEQGDKGWELTTSAVAMPGNNVILFFKRPKQ